MKIWITILIIIFVYLLLRPLIIIFLKKKIEKNKCKLGLKSGDLILFMSNKFRPHQLKTVFTHVALCLEIDDKCYIFEHGQNKSKLILLTRYIKKYDGEMHLIKLKKELSTENIILLKNKINEFIKIYKFPKKKLFLKKYFLHKFLIDKKEIYLNCSEIIYKLLIDANIINREETSYFSKTPDDFLKLHEYRYCGIIDTNNLIL